MQKILLPIVLLVQICFMQSVQSDTNDESALPLRNLPLTFETNFMNKADDLNNPARTEGQPSSDEFFVSGEEIDLGPSGTLTSERVLNEIVTKYPILIPNSQETATESEISLLPTYDEEYQSTDGTVLPRRGRIDSSGYFKRSCGDMKEKCPEPEGTRVVNGSHESSWPSRRKVINYMKQPSFCRCDRGVCDEYGDCCSTIAKTLLYDNPWRCHMVQHELIWALMISKCPDPEDPNREHCENPDLLPEKQQTYLHDLPIYNNFTRKLYRNIYCAKCNSIPHEEIYPLRIRILCSKNFTKEERDTFISEARYQPRKRLWINEWDNTACGIISPDLDFKRLPSVIPDIRYCRRGAVDSCPLNYVKQNPLTAALCSSYTQYVDSKYHYIFKNPHCAECHGIMNKFDLKCLHDNDLQLGPVVSLPQPGVFKISPGSAGAKLESTGLGLLFHFDLGEDVSYVGYEMKCTGDTIWDFLRQKCTTTLCAKDHKYDITDGTCKPLLSRAETPPNHITPSETPPSNTEFDPGEVPNQPQNITSDTEASLNPPLNSSCYILIIQPHEYLLLENKSILVNRTLTPAARGTSPVIEMLIFHPGEYSSWNDSDSTLAICAQELASGFSNRFSPILSYISLIALGISVFFSLLHIVLFIILPKMRNLPGKNLFCLTLSLFISQLVFLSLIGNKTRAICILASVIMHYFFLASFFWMNIMSFDIWRTFSSEFMMSRNSSRGSKTFLKYSIFAWITPAIIVTSSVLLDFWIADSPLFQGDSYELLKRMRPLYGHNNLCWISQGLSLFIFFALPAAILICLNMILFTLTAKAILEQSQDTQNFFKSHSPQGQGHIISQSVIEKSPTGEKPPSTYTSQRIVGPGGGSDAEIDRMKLYAKLAIIMGVTWILGFLSGVSEWQWLWYPFVILNGLQGTFIFFAFDVKSKVWEMLKSQVEWDIRVMSGLKGAGGGGGGGGIGHGVMYNRRDTTTSTSSTNMRTTTFREGSVPRQIGVSPI